MQYPDQDYCRVCGLLQPEPPWGEDGRLPSFNICDCCGVEFGYGDATSASIDTFRQKWIAGGARWQTPSKKPSNWDLSAQLSNIPAEYR